jgi:hypothetical protein
MTSKRPNRLTILIIACVTLYLVILALWGAVPSFYSAGRPFAGYLTVTTSTPHQRARELLTQAGIYDVVTPETTMVKLTRFGHVDEVSLRQALSLDELDPRRDPFVTGSAAYFADGDRYRLFLRPQGTLFRLRRLLNETLDDVEVAEWQPVRVTVALVVFCTVCATVAVAFGRMRIVLAAIALPWVAVIVTGGMVAAVSASLAIIACAWIERGLLDNAQPSRARVGASIEPIRIRLFIAGMMATVVLLSQAMTGGPRALAISGCALVASGLAVAVPVLLLRMSRGDSGHQLFIPVVILRPGIKSLVDTRWISPMLVTFAGLLLLPPVLDRAMPGGVGARAVPVPGRDGYDFEALSRLSGGVVESDLPNITDYLSHVAFQESLAFGRDYRFPELGETVFLDRFAEQADGTYRRYEETILRFDREWFDQQVDNALPGIPRMLASLGGAAGVVLDSTESLYSRYRQIVQHLIAVLLVFVPFLYAAVPWHRIGRDHPVIVEIARRRKRVA